MKRHIIGLIIFGFIISVTAVIASFFVKMPPIPVLEPVFESRDFVYSGGKHCPGKRKKPRPKESGILTSVKVTQAVFDVKKKQLDTQFLIERGDEAIETVNVALHFFVYDQFGVQHIADEFVTLNPNFDMGDVAISKNIASFKWLTNLESRENLYVISVVTDKPGNRLNPPEFNSSEATAVLLSPRIANK